jgi:hypothetical protein
MLDCTLQEPHLVPGISWMPICNHPTVNTRLLRAANRRVARLKARLCILSGSDSGTAFPKTLLISTCRVMPKSRITFDAPTLAFTLDGWDHHTLTVCSRLKMSRHLSPKLVVSYMSTTWPSPSTT